MLDLWVQRISAHAQDMDVKLTNLRLDDPDARCREEMFVEK